MKKKNILSLFLVLILIFGVFPSSAFATDPGNNSGVGGGEASVYAGNFIYSWDEDCYGIRFSLYFAEKQTQKDLDSGNAKFFQIGETIDVKISGDYTAKYSTQKSVYFYMHGDESGIWHYNRQKANIIDKKEIDCLTKPLIERFAAMRDVNDVATYDKFDNKDLNIFFMGVDELDWTTDGNGNRAVTPECFKEMDFKNTAEIAQYIVDHSGMSGSYGKITADDFKNGILTKNGQRTKGIYKLFYELFYTVGVGNDKDASKVQTLFTFRDAIAFYNASKDIRIYEIQGPLLAIMANRLYLAEDEVYLNMKGNSKDFQFDVRTINRAIGFIKKNTIKGKPGYDSMGCGVVTGGTYGNGPEIIKTYVMVTGVKADGTLEVKKAAPSTKLNPQKW